MIEFLGAGHDMTILLDAFEQLLPSPVLLRSHVDGLNKIPPGGTFDWDRLNDLSNFLRQKSGMDVDDTHVTRSEFRSLMSDFFGFDDEILIGNMFDTMDKDGSATVSYTS